MANIKFTPKNASGDRVEIFIDEADLAKIKRGEGWSAEVTDRNTNRRYLVRGAPCDLPHCYCDAIIICELTSN